MRKVKIERFCECVNDGMGWGCCCSRPQRAIFDEDGDHVVITLEEYNELKELAWQYGELCK